MSLTEIVEMLRTAERQGAEIDQPEGSRYIQISNTLANRLADAIEKELTDV